MADSIVEAVAKRVPIASSPLDEQIIRLVIAAYRAEMEARGYVEVPREMTEEPVSSAALRKAKADGVRWAAGQLAYDAPKPHSTIIQSTLAKFEDMAARIEKGEA